MSNLSHETSRKVAIITDTSSTIKPEEIKDVYVISMMITLENKNLKDGREISAADIFKYLQNHPKNADLKTSSPVTMDMVKLATEVAQKYDEVIILPLTSGLSATYNQWKLLLESELKAFKNLHLFQTNDIAISLKWLVEDVLDLLKKHASIAEITTFIQEWHSRIACTVVLNDLTQVKRGGRIGKIKAIIAGLLKIKPILQFHGGKNTLIDRAFSNKTAIEKSFNLFEKLLGISKTSPKIMRLGFCNSFRDKTSINAILNELKEVAQAYGVKTIEQSFITPVISAHTGNDAFSISVLIHPKNK